MTEDQIRAAVTQAQSGVQSRRRDAAAQAGAANAAEGAAFLKANAAKPGVVTLPGGLQYQIITAGTGPKPKLEDEVVCNYRGTLISGKVFDSSYDRGEPASFQVGGVIKGWTQALQLMPVGSKWRLFVPADLAYGAEGAGDGAIGPNATLIFEVELLSIKPKG
jgi:FKBP-type peptidyl-prolyl cis-trans isomerase FklB